MLITFLWFYIIFIDYLNGLNSYQCFKSKNLNLDHCNQCDYGSECILSNRNSRNVTCKCIENCYSYGDSIDSREVCSSDGSTFKSTCHFNKYLCETKKELTIKYFDKCDPCKGINCLPNQTCIVDDNRQPICKCDDNCNLIPFDPVCASDGKSYFNECILGVQACKQRRELKVLSKGECTEEITKLCLESNCTNYEFCNVDSNYKASCVCQNDCPPIFVPVCGSSSNTIMTYDSICELKKHSCQLKQEISILYYGICGQQNLCDNIQCNFGSICLINSTTFEPYCSCDECSMEYQPVCADDGLTYTNHCFLKRKACISQKEIHQLYDGICNGCMLHKCDNYSTCKINQETQKAECVCIFDCNDEKTNSTNEKNAPICAIDKEGNKQIYSECEMKKKSCETKTELTILSDLSNCEICKNVHCKYGAHCNNNSGKCICPIDCPKDLYEPVCSNHGSTFSNECELRKFACQNSRNSITGNLNYDRLDNYTILFYGECNKQQQNSNEEIKLIPVIGKTSIVISGQMVGNYVTMCNENSCKFGGRCYYNDKGTPTCLCLFDCPIQKTDRKQCGSDGRLYQNSCKLNEEICLRQQKIDTQPLKECLINRNYSICNGSLPQSDKLSGKFIDCNSKSLFFKECSSNHTCLHHRKVIPSIRTVLTFKDQDHFCCLKQDIDPSKLNELNSYQIEETENKCNCNKLGTELPIERCDENGQCFCKPGVEGLKCERCKIGFYAFHKLNQGISGCLPCNCNRNGRVREDCRQSTGQCICKIDVTGMKCDTCPNGKKLTATGCIDDALLKVHNKKCASLRCRFGAICKEIRSNKSQCVCNHSCRKRFELNYHRRFERDYNRYSYLDDYFNYSINKYIKRDKSKYNNYLSRPLCGSDNNTYVNECEMKIHGCKMQKKIVKIKDGQCSSLNEPFSNWQTSVTQTPVRRSTLEKETDFYDFVDEGEESTNVQTESSLSSLGTNLYEEENRINFNPMFSGRSFIRLSRLETSTYLKLEIDLIPFSDKGIIFYNGHNSHNDFISLTLCNGYFEYRFNLGSGISTLRSKEKIQKYQLTKVTLIKDFKRGTLIVNDQPEVNCVAEGNWKSLDLNENFYLGWIKTNYEKIYENLNSIRTGFIGCILKLELGKNDKELKNVELINSNELPNYDYKSTTSILFDINSNKSQQSKMKILEMESINNCSSLTKNKINFCSKFNPCSKNSLCVNLINNTFDCICPSNLDRCSNIKNELLTSKQIEDNQPIDFYPESWIKSKTLLNNINRAFAIELWFLSRSKNGLLIYAQKGRKGDFLSLNIRNGKLEFIFNLGSKIPNFSGVVKIKSEEPIILNYWNRVKIARLDDYATMQVNDGKIYSGQAKGNLTELNLEEPYFIGGMNNFSDANPDANLSNKHFLNGAIQRIIVNGDHLVGPALLRSSSDKANISSYLGPPCTGECTNEKSQCIPLLNNYECKYL